MIFPRIAAATAKGAGHPAASAVAFGSIALWVAFGPMYGFSAEYQMIVNTGTTIVTFLLAFLIQNTQARESQAINARLDELIRAIPGARNALIGIDADPDVDIEGLRCQPCE